MPVIFIGSPHGSTRQDLHRSPGKGSPAYGRQPGTFCLASVVIRLVNYLETEMWVVRGLLAALALAGLSSSASAQQLPPGSYQRSCGNIQLQGTILSAVCRAANGREVRTALGIGGCVGDIGNNNGQLQCNGGQPTGSPRQGYPGATGPAAGAGYPSGYGPGPGHGEDYRERCDQLEHEAHKLRHRLEHTPYGDEHMHLEHRLREVNYQRQHCRHR
jgi:CVNH domain